MLLHAAAQLSTLVPPPIQSPAAWHSIPVITTGLFGAASHVAAPSVVVLPLKPELQAHV